MRGEDHVFPSFLTGTSLPVIRCSPSLCLPFASVIVIFARQKRPNYTLMWVLNIETIGLIVVKNVEPYFLRFQ